MSNSEFKHPDKANAGQNAAKSRRSILKKAAAATVGLAGADLLSLAIRENLKKKSPGIGA